jgi:hypothetical protein
MCKLHHTDTHRTCSKCRQLLPLDAFQQRKSGCCKDCNRAMGRERRARKRAEAQKN